VLNRKFADLRHAPRLDPHVLSYDPRSRPQSLIRLGPGSRRKVKGGVILAEPGFTWALFLFPRCWYVLTSVFDRQRQLVGHHVDLCLPPEEKDGVLSYLDLKLDLVLPAAGTGVWVDRDHLALEIEAGTVSPAWLRRIEQTAAEIDRDRARGTFPPEVVRRFTLTAALAASDRA
jgi:hypothetical protein